MTDIYFNGYGVWITAHAQSSGITTSVPSAADVVEFKTTTQGVA